MLYVDAIYLLEKNFSIVYHGSPLLKLEQVLKCPQFISFKNLIKLSKNLQITHQLYVDY